MSGIDFAFQIGGKFINPAELEDRELAAGIEEIIDTIMQEVGDLVCPEHNESPRFLCVGDDFDEITVETQGCCEKLIEEVKKRMNL